jgi:hypothetical protein
MKTKHSARLFIALALVLNLGTGMGRAQDNSAKAQEERKPDPAFHLDFNLNELQDGKKINTRSYAMDLIAAHFGSNGGYRSETPGQIKIGTRVPIETDQGKVDYMDLGTSIRCNLSGNDAEGPTIDVRAEVTSVVPRADTDAYRPATRNPIIRQISMSSSTAMPLGKLTTLSTVEDPDSKREFQLEVTVTKLR